MNSEYAIEIMLNDLFISFILQVFFEIRENFILIQLIRMIILLISFPEIFFFLRVKFTPF